MSDSVETADNREANREPDGQLRVVQDGLGNDLGIATGFLQPVFSYSVDSGYLLASIRRRYRDNRQRRFERNRLAESNRRTPTNRHSTVCVDRLCVFARAASVLDGNMHLGAVEDSCARRSKKRRNHFGLSLLLGRTKNQRPAGTQRL